MRWFILGCIRELDACSDFAYVSPRDHTEYRWRGPLGPSAPSGPSGASIAGMPTNQGVWDCRGRPAPNGYAVLVQSLIQG